MTPTMVFLGGAIIAAFITTRCFSLAYEYRNTNRMATYTYATLSLCACGVVAMAGSFVVAGGG